MISIILCIILYALFDFEEIHVHMLRYSGNSMHILVYSIRMHVHAALMIMIMRMHASARILLDNIIMNNIMHACTHMIFCIILCLHAIIRTRMHTMAIFQKVDTPYNANPYERIHLRKINQLFIFREGFS